MRGHSLSLSSCKAKGPVREKALRENHTQTVTRNKVLLFCTLGSFVSEKGHGGIQVRIGAVGLWEKDGWGTGFLWA